MKSAKNHHSSSLVDIFQQPMGINMGQNRLGKMWNFWPLEGQINPDIFLDFHLVQRWLQVNGTSYSEWTFKSYIPYICTNSTRKDSELFTVH